MTTNTNYILTTSQENAIEQLRRRIGEGVDDFKTMDQTFMLYRFLKARNWDVDKAEIMLEKCIQFKRKIDVDALITTYEQPAVLKKYFSNFLIGCDKEGCLVLYIALGKSDPRGLHKATKPFEIDKAVTQWFVIYEIALEEKMKQINRWLSGFIMIFDMNGLTFANATFKKGLEDLIRLAKSQQDNAPERLKSVYFINAPSFFTIPFSIVKSVLSYETQRKFHLYGTEGWQEELLRVIDADQLPAFMGGTRTDPDGNPLCKTLINQMGKIDESYYLVKDGNPLENSPGVKKLNLYRSSSTKIPLHVSASGSVIEWEFETKAGDIGFGLFYKETGHAEEQVVELVPLERVDTQDYVESGMYKCEKAGEYFVLFDNSYSWFRSKKLFYRIKVLKPSELEDHMTINQF